MVCNHVQSMLNLLSFNNVGMSASLLDIPCSQTTFFIGHTTFVQERCEECHNEFRTYIPETLCKMPDGMDVFYADPQLLCPRCDINGFGYAWNDDMM